MSKNFSLLELIHSDTAIKEGFTEQSQPPNDVIDNLTALADNVLQPLRDAYGKPITVNCGYRCKRVNDAVGGVANSQHLTGEAADITTNGDNEIIFNLIQSLNLPFDQLLNESNLSWVHVSHSSSGKQRKQILSL